MAEPKERLSHNRGSGAAVSASSVPLSGMILNSRRLRYRIDPMKSCDQILSDCFWAASSSSRTAAWGRKQTYFHDAASNGVLCSAATFPEKGHGNKGC